MTQGINNEDSNCSIELQSVQSDIKVQKTVARTSEYNQFGSVYFTDEMIESRMQSLLAKRKQQRFLTIEDKKELKRLSSMRSARQFRKKEK